VPLFKTPPDGAIRWAKGDTTQQAANSDNAVSVSLTVPAGRKFTVFQVLTDQSSASIDLLCKHVQGGGSVTVVDRNSSLLSTDERGVVVNEICVPGDQFTAGIRNRTGAGVTPVIVVGYIDAGA
jgi:hypothetical protein